MDILTVRHFTRYRYASPVAFGEHRMMFRPRESFDQHVLSASLTITPKPVALRYVHDVFGNCIGIARFATQAKELTFESNIRLEHTPEDSLDDPTSPDRSLNAYPFAYEPVDLPDVYSSMLRGYQDEDRTLDKWSRRFLQGLPKVDAPSVLSAMTHAIHDELKYVARLSGPPQTPLETLRAGSGTCRDFAVLMMEAVRTLGLAARFVSGYIYVTARENVSPRRLGGGNTHAWVRVFLPNGGWAEFDPTNGLVGNRDLIRVAVVRDPVQATPLSGTWEGKPDDYLGMDVEVQVTVEEILPKSSAGGPAGAPPDREVFEVLIRGGYNIAVDCTAPTPLLLMVHLRPERGPDLQEPEKFTLVPEIPYHTYVDGFGNVCTRLVAPVGRLSLWNRFVIRDSGLPEHLPEGAAQHAVEDLPDDALVFLLGSRYCDTQKLLPIAWSLFGDTAPGWPRVKAILSYAHERIRFDYAQARADRTAWDAHEERVGVCRDYAHLAIALCRCMNIPARYCTGYLGDIGVPLDPNPMDFSAWFEVYLGGAWQTMDARHFHPRIGRIPMAYGRDAIDAAISTAFGVANLVEFTVITDELKAA